MTTTERNTILRETQTLFYQYVNQTTNNNPVGLEQKACEFCENVCPNGNKCNGGLNFSCRVWELSMGEEL